VLQNNDGNMTNHLCGLPFLNNKWIIEVFNAKLYTGSK